MCHLWSRPVISSARKINLTHTVVTAPEDTEVRCSAKTAQRWSSTSQGNGGWQWGRLPRVNLKLGDCRKGQGGRLGRYSCGFGPHQRHGVDGGGVQLHPRNASAVAECYERNRTSAEGIRVEAASDDAGSHWSGRDVGCRCHLFSINNVCHI
jgi:hypothetical protein